MWRKSWFAWARRSSKAASCAYVSAAGPLHHAIWGSDFSTEVFRAGEAATPAGSIELFHTRGHAHDLIPEDPAEPKAK